MTNQTQDIPSFLLAPQQELAFADGASAVTQAVVGLPDGLAADDLRSALAGLVAYGISRNRELTRSRTAVVGLGCTGAALLTYAAAILVT